MWPLASRPSRSRSTRYFCPMTTRPTCSRSGGIHCPISCTCCVISCVDFIRKVRQVRREDRSVKGSARRGGLGQVFSIGAGTPSCQRKDALQQTLNGGGQAVSRFFSEGVRKRVSPIRCVPGN